MYLSKITKKLVDGYPYIGPIMWIASIQYLIISLVVARAFKTYSYLHNYISDLGNTHCGLYICSPKHQLMNISFVVIGVTMAVGAMFIYPLFKKSRASLVGFSFIALGGLGSILVGWFPENTIRSLHTSGAILDLFVANIGIVILGYSLNVQGWLKIYTLFSGFIASLSFILFASKVYLGVGIGGMERLADYPQTIWLIISGFYLLATKSSHKKYLV
jgi:hypothetical membrane protein